jgi:hypothetical protein
MDFFLLLLRLARCGPYRYDNSAHLENHLYTIHPILFFLGGAPARVC